VSRTLAVFRRDWNELVHSRAFVVVAMANVVASIAGGVLGQFIERSTLRTLGLPEPWPYEVLEGFSRIVNGSVLLFVILIPFLTLIWAFAGPLMTAERSSGKLPTLLATPLSPRELWYGKTMALYGASLCLAVVSIALSIGSGAVAAPFVVSRLVISISAVTVVLVAVVMPIIFLGVAALTIGIAMISDPDAALIPSFLVGFLIMLGLPVLLFSGAMGVDSVALLMTLTGLAVLVSASAIWVGSRLTTETVVLMSGAD